MNNKGKRVDSGSGEKRPAVRRKKTKVPDGKQGEAAGATRKQRTSFGGFAFVSRLSRFWRFVILSGMVTSAVILAALLVWDRMFNMVEGGIGGYTPPEWVYDDPDEDGGTPGIIQQNPASAPRPTPAGLSVRENVYTFLLAGRNQGLTDSLMVATLDLTANTIEVLSIPRDTVIPIAARSLKKINGAYNSGGGKEEGMSLLLSEIDSIVGFMPKHYLSVDMNGFVKLVDAVGPIGFNVPVKMSYPPEDIYFEKGYQELNGSQALKLVRYRSYAGGAGGMEHDDYGRMQMQQMFIKEVAKKVLRVENIVKIPELADIGIKNTLSNMTLPELVAVAERVFDVPAENIRFHTLPTYSVAHPAELTGSYYEAVSSEEALQLINETINPFNLDITADMVEHIKLTEK